MRRNPTRRPTIDDRPIDSTPLATAILLAVIFGAGVIWFVVVSEATASAGEWMLACAGGLVAAVGLMLRRTRADAGAAVVIVASLASIVSVPALMSTLFMTGLLETARRQAVTYLAASAAIGIQFGIWVLVVGPDRTPGGYAAIALAHAASFGGAAITGSAAGRIRARRDDADREVVATREREASVVADVRVQERLRIAHSLHDSIGRHLAVAHIYGAVLQQRGLLSEEEISTTSTELLRATDGIADDLQRILATLHPDAEGDFERARDLPVLLDRFEHAASLASMTLQQRVDLEALAAAPADVAATVVDFLSESTTNVLKYGSEGKVTIVVSMRTPTTLEARVSNDRSLISRRSIISTGMGLMALRERAALLDGALTIVSEPTRFCVSLTLPVHR